MLAIANKVESWIVISDKINFIAEPSIIGCRPWSTILRIARLQKADTKNKQQLEEFLY